MTSPANDLTELFALLADTLQATGVVCLLIGGFAVNHYGYTRNTLDIDLMIASDQREVVRKAMMRAGFTNVAAHDTVTFFNRPGSALRVDFLQVDAETMAKLFSGSSVITFYGHQVRVPSLSDLLAMKFFALSQAPERRMEKDLPDIAYLAILNDLDCERDLRPLARQYATEDIYQAVCKKIASLQS